MIDALLSPLLYVARVIPRDEAVPYPQYPSGVVNGQDSIYRFPYPSNKNPMLSNPYNIADENGRGILPGHYETALSPDSDFILLFENRRLKARIPVIKIESMDNNPDEERKKDLKRAEKAEKERQKREKRKNYKEFPPEDFIHLYACIEKCADNSYIIHWERGNVRATAVIKLEN